MLGLDQTTLIIMVLAALAVGAVAYAFLFNSIESERKTDKRLKSIGSRATGGRVAAGGKKQGKISDAQKRKKREEALKALDEQRQAAVNMKNPPLNVRLKQAGLSITPQTYWLISAVLGLGSAAVLLLLGREWYYAVAIGFCQGVGTPKLFVAKRRKKRIKLFLKEFAGSIDVIVRGLRSGLPLNDCIRIISRDAQEPVRSEFQTLVENQQMGLTLPECCVRLAERVPCPETNFFAIVLTIQAQAGGNLGEALGNLSSVLRSRQAMTDKIGALSMEAKASAYIIAALPLVVGVLVHISSPGYLNPLWEHPTGQTVMMGCAVSMFTGVMVMKKMINFDF